jgi:hypothetical protein
MNIIGLDVGRCNIVAAALDHFPVNPQRYFNEHRSDFVRLSVDRVGVDALLAMKPDGLVLEPTGGWYSAFWRELATTKGIPVYWVGHADLSYQRGSYGFQNKRDDEDAFCLALTYFDDRFINRQGSKRFLRLDDGAIARVREKFLELEQIDKIKTALINQTRQRLAYEFPEVAERNIQPSKKLHCSPFWAWLAGEYSYPRIVNDYKRSVAHEASIQLSPYTQLHARSIITLEKRQYATETELIRLLELPEFHSYIKVFKRFRFGLRNQALLLLQCYPFEKFLVDGQPWIEWELATPKHKKRMKDEAKPNPKRQKRHRSLRSFQAYLGLSYKLKQSGDSLKKKFLGSDLVRAHLYMWCVSMVCTRKLTPNLTVGKELLEKLDKLEYNGVEGSDKVTRLLFRATALLFQELVKELT